MNAPVISKSDTDESMFCVIMLLICATSDAFGYKIIFDEIYSPPKHIPKESSMYYSVPLNQEISKPIMAYLVYTNRTRATEGLYANSEVRVQTIDAKTAKDRWKYSGGSLCQNAVWDKDYPERADRSQAKIRCGSSSDKTVLKVPIFKGRIILDGIFHSHPHQTAPQNPRILRIINLDPKLLADSNPFLITTPADRIEISKQPPASVTTNYQFQVTANIRDQSGNVITTGLDSIAYVDLTIPYYYKTFFGTMENKMLLKHSTIRLAGEGNMYTGNENRVIRKRASKGIVTFNNIRILDTVNNLQLNLTMTMARSPWTRIPNCPSCYDDVKSHISNGTEITFANLGSTFYKKIKSMALTKPINVLAQTVRYIQILQHTIDVWSKWTDPTLNAIRITRNVPIPGVFTVYALDTNRERIYSGPDAQLKLKYTTVPPGVCISSDATPAIHGGASYLYVSICQVIANVRLIVSLANKSSISVTTPSFHVGGMLHVAHLGDFRYSGHGVQIDSHINSFIRIAIDLYNEGILDSLFTKAGFKIKLHSFNTQGQIVKAIKAFRNMAEFALDPENTLTGVISSVTDEVTVALSAEMGALKIPYISTSNSDLYFSDQSAYQYLNRVCWGELAFIQTLIKINLERNWNMIIILREIKVTLNDHFRKLMNNANINTERELIFHEPNESLKNSGKDIRFESEIRQIKKWKCQIIYLFADAEMQSYILRAAYLGGLDTEHGYQWVIVGSRAWEFPFQNMGVCARGPKNCTTAFKGTLLISETYDVDTSNKDWNRAFGRYFASDKYEVKGGIVRYRSIVVSAKMALGYDAIMLLVHGLRRVVSQRLSIRGSTVNNMIRYGSFQGLTGEFRMSPYGNRVGFLCFLAQVNTPMHNFNYIHLRLKDESGEFEIPFQSVLNEGTEMAEVILPNSPKFNKRIYVSRTGMISLTTQRIIRNQNEPWPSEVFFRSENITPVFTCTHDCGFNPADDSDVNIYDSGVCTRNDYCRCKIGFHGKNCTDIICMPLCVNGNCVSPDICECQYGWYGKTCNTAICDSCLETNGNCTSPGRCTCFPHKLGWDCSIYIEAVVIPFIFGILLLSVISYFSTKKFLDHLRHRSALSNLNWVVNWSTVESCQPELSFISRTSVSKRSITFPSAIFMEIFVWKNEKWYVKTLPNFTISLDDVNVRLEMVELTQIKHNNVITFGGACLTDPNVSLFMEVAHKGSLNDVLHLASFDLGWEFRYSFMKDICSGMRYLHEETRIGSHGRLKSHNCLIDSHWTIKISGFGAPSLRYGKYRTPRETHAEDLKSLLWTAPELLENAKCLDDIRNGTKFGDIYSFAIVVFEILSWSDPYEYELEYISERSLLDLIVDPSNSENQSSRLKWKEIGGMNMLNVRPILREGILTQTVLRRKMIRCILAEAWDQVPSARPSFKKLLLMLEECYPTSGGLIDNLLNLLSSYSDNLELIVLERTREIEESKEKSEHLLGQLLPRNVSEELKQGRKIVPELFECVTMYFSDIVDFADILTESSPSEIVDFLNSMYGAFDKIVNKYKVYKVETISDTYIVVSGLPERIGNQHAGEIATMSLDLLHMVTTYQIPHRPDTTLQIRIGIHSGPVVSGIVGTMMPRYCLFGDTVNTASRMESSCIALRIHISDTTARILGDLGGYHLDCRGIREVKGRGYMCTWWLEGKDGFDKPLPDKSLAIPLSRHRFK